MKNASAQGRWASFRTYRYGERGDLVAAIDALGNEHQYTYDGDHRLVRRREPGGLVAEFRYHDEGRCVETWCQRPDNDALDREVPELLSDGETKAKGFCHVKIDDYEHFVEVITSRSKRRIEGNHLDKADMVVWHGNVHSYRFDDAGNVLEYQDGAGNAWRCERDVAGRLRAVIDPSGARTEYDHDAQGAIVEMRDALGGFARYERNPQGDVTAVFDELGLVVALRYDERGLLVEATLPNGGVTRMDHDALANRVAVTEPDGARRRVSYDFLGRVTSFVDERGLETFCAYDDRGSLLSVRRPSGATERYDYDVDGNLSRITDADGRVTTLRWGGIGVVTELVRPDGHAVRYFYDREQDLVRVVNEAGEEHRYVRRGEGRIVEEQTFDGRRIEYRHDAMDRISQIRDAAGHVELVYDPCGRLVERSFSDGRKDEISYDALGRIQGVTSGDVTCEYTHDARGRVVREIVMRGGRRTVIETAYDMLGKAVRTSGPFGTMTIARDVVGRPVDVTLGDAVPLHMAYDPAGYLVERALPGGGRITESMTPDGLPAWVRVISPNTMRAVGPGEPAWVGSSPFAVTFSQSYGWSPAGLLGAVGSGAMDATYTEYPRARNGKVVARQSAHGARREVLEGFGHGPSGELHEAGAQRAYAPGGRLTARGEATFAYDSRGRMTSKTLPDGRQWRFVWGDDDLLQAVVLPDGRTARFTYDPFARRLEKRIERDRVVESVTRYTWSGDVLVHEVREQAAASGDPVVEERAYAVLPEGLLPFADRVRRGGHEDARYYVEAPNGTPAALVRGDGTVVGTLEASLFGKVEGEGAALTPLRFPGQYADEETGLHYNRYRYYDPETGQYLSPEPIRLEGSLTAYAYANGDVLDEVDVDALLRCVITRRDGSQVVRSSGGSESGIHPAVAAALPRTTARQPGDPRPPEGCAEPQALSEHIRDWERRTGRSCAPGAKNWRQNLSSALREVDTIRSETGSNDAVPACPNCSQSIPRLWTMAGLSPPNGRVIGGGTNASRDYHANPTNRLSRPNAHGPMNLGTWQVEGGQFLRRR